MRKRIYEYMILTGLILVVLNSGWSCKNSNKKVEDYGMSRESMVENQIKSRGITDESVLEAMREVPRHLFVPERFRDRAYTDGPLRIGEGQTISQPYIVALMSELLDPESEDVILEIGTGSGYQAAVLSEIVEKVYTIEIIQELASTAEKRLQDLEYENVVVKCGNGWKGWKEHAPYDGIIVTAAPDEVPDALLEQLDVGGKLVVPVGDTYQKLEVITRTESGYEKDENIAVRFVPMTGKPE